LLSTVSFRPVFIIGDHRSGTTLLYQMLTASGCFHVLDAYQVIRYPEIVSHFVGGREPQERARLAQQFAELGLSNRVFDGVRVTPELPEEYGFVIGDTARPFLRPSNLSRFVELCRKVRLIGGSDKPVLLKNPWDVLNFLYVKESFPEAKLIFLQRHPLAVANSQLRAIRSMMETRNEYLRMLAPWYARVWNSPLRLNTMRQLFSGPVPFWKYIVPRHVHRAAHYFLANVDRLNPSDIVCLRYEELCREPAATMEKVLGFLQLKPESSVDYASWIDKRPMTLLPEVLQCRNRILGPIRPYLAHNGYGELAED
jgi:hypothetical protein